MATDKDLKIRILGDSTSLNNSLTDSEKRVKAFADKIGSIGKTMTVVGGAITAVSVGLVKMASDAEETSSKFATVFQDVSDEAAKTAKNLAVNFGLSTKAAKQLLSDTGDLLTGFGFTGQAALDLSTKVNELAVDLASFTNYSGGAEGASAALTKALLGERESVKSLGISILETDVQAKVLELTQKGMTFETDRQAKAYATLLIAQEQSKNAIGDYSRTSEGFANQMRELKARVSDVAVALGEKLLPIATRMVGKVTEVVSKINEWIEAHPKLTGAIVKVGAILGAFALVGGPVLMAVAAFMKAKTVVDSVTFALKLMNIRIGTTGALTTSTLIPSIRGLQLTLAPLVIQFGLIAANVYIWIAALKELNEILHSHRVTAQDVADAENILAEAQQKLADKIGITVDKLKEYQEQGFAVHEMINGVKDVTEKATGSFLDIADALDLVNAKAGVNEWGQVIETFAEWVARLDAAAEATEEVKDKILEMNDPLEYQILLLDREADALREAGVEESILTDWYEKAKNKLIEDSEATKTAIALKEKLAETTKSLTDKIFEWTHTDEEIKLRDINREYDLLIENAKEVFTEYNDLRLAIEAINEARQEEIDGLIKSNEVKSESITKNEGLRTSYEELKPAIEEVGNAIKETKEEVDKWIGAIASEEFWGIGKGGMMGWGGIGTGESFGLPSHKSGINYVQKTGLAVIHEGEGVLNKAENKAYQSGAGSFSPTININNPVVRNDNDIINIRDMIENVLDNYSKQQFNRQGKEILLGV